VDRPRAEREHDDPARGRGERQQRPVAQRLKLRRRPDARDEQDRRQHDRAEHRRRAGAIGARQQHGRGEQRRDDHARSLGEVAEGRDRGDHGRASSAQTRSVRPASSAFERKLAEKSGSPGRITRPLPRRVATITWRRPSVVAAAAATAALPPRTSIVSS
jgi:hypothetical protein